MTKSTKWPMNSITSFTDNNSFLSNFYYHNRLATVEHYYQAAKTNDPSWAARILLADTPGAAKRLGRRAPLTDEWEEVKVDVMYGLLLVKFTDERQSWRLLATGKTTLIEGNTWGDTFWGQCPLGHGQNILGELLMNIRAVLQEMEEAK